MEGYAKRARTFTLRRHKTVSLIRTAQMQGNVMKQEFGSYKSFCPAQSCKMMLATRVSLYVPASAAFPYVVNAGANKTGQTSIRTDKDDNEELVGNNPQDRNWKGMFIAILVILTVCGFIILAVVLLSPDDNIPLTSTVKLSDVLDEEWRSGMVDDAMWRGTKLTYKDYHGNIVAASSPSYIEIIVTNQTMGDYDIRDYVISVDMKYALLGYKKSLHHSSQLQYIIYDIKNGVKANEVLWEGNGNIQSVDFGPTGNQLVFVVDGNLYYKSTAISETTTLTRTGGNKDITNGVADWMYSKKILKSTRAYWWSPNGQTLAYASFDDKEVNTMSMTSYFDDVTQIALEYPVAKQYKVFKPGHKNPDVTIHAVNLRTFKKTIFKKPLMNRGMLDTFQSLTWMNEQELLITWSNRTFTSSSTQKCFINMTTCVNDVITQTTSRSTNGEYHGWLRNLNDICYRSDTNGEVFCILPYSHGGRGGYRHIAKVDTTKKPTKITFLTNGIWEVDAILHFDATTNVLFYTSNELHPASRHIYMVDTNNMQNKKCVTCAVQENVALEQVQVVSSDKEKGKSFKYAMYGDKPCFYFTGVFGENADWCLIRCLGPALPFAVMIPVGELLHLSNMTAAYNHGMIFKPPDRLYDVITPLVRYKTLTTNGREINVKMLTPATLHFGKRPVVFILGDVGEQLVNFKFSLDISSYIVSNAKLIVVLVDGRGSGRTGSANVDAVKYQPGVNEIDDIKIVLNWLKNQPNVDVENVAVVGQGGYAGYTSLLAMTMSENPFSCGVAVSPITNWNYADGVTAEKLLGLPTAKPLVYDKNNIVNRVTGVNDATMAIYHGFEDDIVNVQHSIMLEDAIMKTNVPVGKISFNYYKKLLYSNTDELKDYRYQKSHMLRSASFYLQKCLLENYKKNGPIHPEELERESQL